MHAGAERVAVGKINIVKTPGRAARLVIDNSVCNTNQNCTAQEQFSLPSLQDIQAAYPLREDSEPVAGFSLDVKGAHKTALVRESDRGLLGQRQQERLFFDRVCPFGAIVSHSMSTWDIQISRCGHLVKSRLSERTSGTKKSPLWQNEKVLPLGATLILAFCSCFQIPLSWRKLQLGPAITWIGWEINFGGLLCSAPGETHQAATSASGVPHHRLLSRKQLDRLLGLLQWILHGFPALRPWLCSLYDDMHRPGHQCEYQPYFLARSTRFS